MPDAIKKQIIDRILSNLAPLKPSTFRDITRELDAVKDSKALPALMIYDGPETTVSKTSTQWTCRFPVYFKIVFSSMRNTQATKDALVAEVQKKIEADLTLNSLGGIIDSGNEESISIHFPDSPEHRLNPSSAAAVSLRNSLIICPLSWLSLSTCTRVSSVILARTTSSLTVCTAACAKPR